VRVVGFVTYKSSFVPFLNVRAVAQSVRVMFLACKNIEYESWVISKSITTSPLKVEVFKFGSMVKS